jgi:hypothetical protein
VAPSRSCGRCSRRSCGTKHEEATHRWLQAFGGASISFSCGPTSRRRQFSMPRSRDRRFSNRRIRNMGPRSLNKKAVRRRPPRSPNKKGLSLRRASAVVARETGVCCRGARDALSRRRVSAGWQSLTGELGSQGRADAVSKKCQRQLNNVKAGPGWECVSVR